MKTATAVLATISNAYRGRRHQAGDSERVLQNLAQYSSDFTVKMLAQGVLYADATGRTTGTLAMALRKATPWQAACLVSAMAKAGLTLQCEVAAWLNRNAMAILA